MAFGAVRGTLSGFGGSVLATSTATGSVAVQTGDLIVVVMGEATATATISAVTDNLGGTYTSTNTTNGAGEMFWKYVASSGTLTTVNCTATASGNDYAIIAAVFEGPFTSSPKDVHSSWVADTTTPFASLTTGILSQANELVVSCVILSRGQTDTTATAPNVLVLNVASGLDNAANTCSTAMGAYVVAATTAQTPTFAATGTITIGSVHSATFRQGAYDTGAGSSAATSTVTGTSQVDIARAGTAAAVTTGTTGSGSSDIARAGSSSAAATVSATGLATTPSACPLGLIAQSNKSFPTADGGTTDPIDTSGANLLFLHFSHDVAVNSFTISDSKGNTWLSNSVISDATSGAVSRERTYYATISSTTVGPGHTVTVTATGGKIAIQFSAWRSSTTPSLDQVAYLGGALAHGTGGIGASFSTDLIITSFSGASNPTSVDAPYTILNTIASGTNNYATSVAYYAGSISGFINPLWYGSGNAGVTTQGFIGTWLDDNASRGLASATSSAAAGSNPNTVYWKDSGTPWIKSNASLDAVTPNPNFYSTIRASLPHTSGLWYCEIEFLSGFAVYCGFGVTDDTTVAGTGLDVHNPAQSGGTRWDGLGNFLNGFTAPTSVGLGGITNTSRIGLAIDCDHQELYIANSNTYIGSSNPVTRTNPRIAWYGQAGINIFPAAFTLNGGVRIHAHAATQTYAAPTGYTAWGDTPAAADTGVGTASALSTASAVALGNDTGAGTASAHSTATGASPAATSLVAHAEAYGGFAGGVTNSADTTGANLLILHLTYNIGPGSPTFSDSKSNTWTLLGTSTNASNGRDYVYYANTQTPNVGTGHSVTYGVGGSYSSAELLAFSIPGPWTFDEIQGSVVTSPAAGPSLTTEQAGELVISTVGGDGVVSYISVTDGLNIITSGAGVGSTNYVTASAYKIQPSLATVQATWTATSPNSTAIQIFAFKPGIAAADTGAGTSTATSTVNATGRYDVARQATSTATSTVNATGRSDATANTNSSTATSMANATSRTDVARVGSSTATSVVSATGRADFPSSGTTTTIATAVAFTRTDVLAAGTVTTTSVASGVSAAGQEGIGAGVSTSTATVNATSRTDVRVPGNSTAASIAAATSTTGRLFSGTALSTSIASGASSTDVRPSGTVITTSVASGISAAGIGASGAGTSTSTALANANTRSDVRVPGNSTATSVAAATGITGRVFSGSVLSTSIASGTSSTDVRVLGNSTSLATASATSTTGRLFSGTTLATSIASGTGRVDFQAKGTSTAVADAGAFAAAGYADGTAHATTFATATGRADIRTAGSAVSTSTATGVVLVGIGVFGTGTASSLGLATAASRSDVRSIANSISTGVAAGTSAVGFGVSGVGSAISTSTAVAAGNRGLNRTGLALSTSNAVAQGTSGYFASATAISTSIASAATKIDSLVLGRSAAFANALSIARSDVRVVGNSISSGLALAWGLGRTPSGISLAPGRILVTNNPSRIVVTNGATTSRVVQSNKGTRNKRTRTVTVM